LKQDTEPPGPGAWVHANEGCQCIGLQGMGPTQGGFVGELMDVVHRVQALMQEDHRQLRIPQGRVELNTATREIGLTEQTQALSGFDRQASDGPGLIAHQDPMRSKDSGAQMRAAGTKQCPTQSRIATDPLRQAAGKRMGEMLLRALVKQDGLRVVHQPNDRMQKGPAPGYRAQAFTNQDAFGGEVDAAMPSSDRHLMSGGFTNRDGIRSELERRREGQVSQVSNRHGPNIMIFIGLE